MLRRLALLLPILAILAGLILIVGNQKVADFGTRPLVLSSEQVYQLKSGSSFRRMVKDLEALGVIEEPLLFRLYARKQGGANRIRAGEYALEQGMSHAELFENLVQGRVIQRQLTFVEGMRLRDFLSLMKGRERIESVLDGLSPEAIAKRLGIAHNNPEGWIYPDTYSYTRGTTDLAMLEQAVRRMQTVLGNAWPKRAPDLPLKTPYQALILASIVEKETAAPEERPAIGGVFIRRLKKGMRLQTDPTVIYGLGEAYRGNITRADLKRKTPYNTYRIKGLPPTPIASPGREAIEAVLHPAEGKALYFVAKGDGHHHFSATLEEHNRAVYQYQKRGRRKDYRSVPTGKSES